MQELETITQSGYAFTSGNSNTMYIDRNLTAELDMIFMLMVPSQGKHHAFK